MTKVTSPSPLLKVLVVFLLLGLMGCAKSCGSKDDDDETEDNVTNPAGEDPTDPISAPSGITVRATAEGNLITWGTVDGATAYHLYWSTESDVSTAGTKLSDVASPYLHTGLTAAITYYYAVVSEDASGESSLSTVVDATALPPWEGAKLLGVAGVDTLGVAVTADSNDNILTCGLAFGGLDGNSLAGAYDLYLTKYNSSGEKQWTSQLGVAAAITSCSGLAMDNAGDIYLSGATQGNLDGETKTGTTDIALVKYNSDGIKQFVKLLGVAAADSWGNGIALAGDAIYVAGQTDGDLDGNTLAGTIDMVLVKYDFAGDRQWTKQLGIAAAETKPTKLAAGSSGNIYIVGVTMGNLDGQTLEGTEDAFLTKYDSDGNSVWTRLLGVAGSVTQGNGVALDSNGNIYVNGKTDGDLDGHTLIGTEDGFIARFDSDGNKDWSVLIGGAGGTIKCPDLTIGSDNMVYVTGDTDVELHGETFIEPSTNGYIVKYNADGTRQWTRLLGKAGSIIAPLSVTADSFDNVYINGFTSGGIDDQAATGTYDFFVVKYNSAGEKR